MRAAVLEQAGSPLLIRDVPRPEVGPGEVLLRVRACGVCHTDLHLAAGDWRLPKLPLIPGHEVTGIIEQVGAEVRELKVGDRAGIPWIYWSCGSCEYCLANNEPLCSKLQVTGYTVDGGYAEYLKAPASHCIPLPEGIDFVSGAPLYCAALTTYRALKISGARVGQTVAIWGVGGLGHYAVQIARAMGLRVIAVDILESKLDFARELGVDFTVNAKEKDSVKTIKKAGGADVVINLAPTSAAIEQGFQTLRRGGALVLVGLPKGNFTLPIFTTVAKGIRILTAAVGTRQDLREVLSLAAEKKIHSVCETVPLDEVNSVFRRMEEGQITGRVVIEFP